MFTVTATHPILASSEVTSVVEEFAGVEQAKVFARLLAGSFARVVATGPGEVVLEIDRTEGEA